MAGAEGARAAADLAEGSLLATVDVAAPPDRVFRALVSDEVLRWWVRPGVFDTREWSADVRAGGRWRAGGIGGGKPYVLEGQFLEVEPPRKLVHTWELAGAPGTASTATYVLEPSGEGTRITLRQSGFQSRDACLNTAVGWETSFNELSRVISSAGRDL